MDDSREYCCRFLLKDEAATGADSDSREEEVMDRATAVSGASCLRGCVFSPPSFCNFDADGVKKASSRAVCATAWMSTTALPCLVLVVVDE